MKALGQGADGSPRAGCLLASGSEDALGLLLASTFGQRHDGERDISTSSAGCSGPALRGVALPPREGRARSSGPGDEGGAFEGPGGGFCGDRRGRRSARAREKKGEGDAGGERERTAREKRTGDWRESAAGWYRGPVIAK